MSLSNQILTTPRPALLVLAASLAALIFVFVMQFAFGYDPCILCWYQRVPYAVTVLLAGFASLPAQRPRARILLWLCAATFLIGAGLAIFHTGVEQHWWLRTSGCAILPLGGESAEDFRTKLLHMAVPHCDVISWKFLGLSMANYNILGSLALAVFSVLAARRAGR